jgi:N-acetylmuramoyl-L-alanine amidase
LLVQPSSLYQNVAWLQTKLNNALKSISGFIPLKVDGDYGNKTKTAVIKYYELQGWKTDGLKVGIFAIGRLNKC